MTITNDPLITDIFTMFRDKSNTVDNIKEIIGSDECLRMYREFPQEKPKYPLITMLSLNTSSPNLDYLYRDYFIRLTIYTKSTNKSNQDVLEQELFNLFSDPDTNFSKNNTKIEFVHPQPVTGEFFDEKNRCYILPITYQVRARRKTNVN